jgi:DNA-binding NarL/FixJ family response regulator
VRRLPRSPADSARDLRALVATADRHLAAWAREQLPAAGLNVCDEAGDLERAVRVANELGPDLCLLDVALPGGAMTALHSIRNRAPAAHVVLLAAVVDDPVLLPALRAGASGCIVGMPDGRAVKRALNDVLAGHTAIPRALLTRLVVGLGPA